MKKNILICGCGFMLLVSRLSFAEPSTHVYQTQSYYPHELVIDEQNNDNGTYQSEGSINYPNSIPAGTGGPTPSKGGDISIYDDGMGGLIPVAQGRFTYRDSSNSANYCQIHYEHGIGGDLQWYWIDAAYVGGKMYCSISNNVLTFQCNVNPPWSC